jgi:ketosteroid isomerase-like protein
MTWLMATTTDGQNVDLWFRATLGFRKIDGKWTITHEHSSVPFYMDGSFKAAIDLKP